VVLDPLDGTGNFRAGLPPWAFSAALVHRRRGGGRAGGRPVVGPPLGRRSRAGAWRDGVPARVREGSTVVAPSGRVVRVPSTAWRVRITGCTPSNLCLVADGSAGAWHDLDAQRHATCTTSPAGWPCSPRPAGCADRRRGVRCAAPDTETLIRFRRGAGERAVRDLIAAVRD
jgi:3'(2'), 5'-bisphosphate nucleotidase